MSQFCAQEKLPNRPKECKQCIDGKAGKKRGALYFCDTREGKPAMHTGDCFTNYHYQSCG